jgi:hypothetical protein
LLSLGGALGEPVLFVLGFSLALALLFIVFLGEVDNLDGVNVLLAQQAQEALIILLLEFVALPRLYSAKARPFIPLWPLLIDQLLVVDEVLELVLRIADEGGSSSCWVTLHV